MVNGISQNYGYGNYYLDNIKYNPIQLQNSTNTTLFGGVEERKDNTADGKDDGSIGFWGATKNLAKGAWNFVTSPFKNDRGEWSLGSTLKSAAIAGAFVLGNALTGGALTPILLAGGAIAGVYGAGKAAYNIATAETDAQAEDAWQSMGSSTATIVATAVGAKGYAKAQATASGMTDAEITARYGGLKGIKNSVGKTFVDSYDNAKAAKTYLFGAKAKPATSTTAATPAVEGKVQQGWSAVKDAYNNSSKETWYGKAGDVAKQGKELLAENGEEFLIRNSETYGKNYFEAPDTKLTYTDKFNVLKETVTNIAKEQMLPQTGYQKGQGVWDNTKAIASNPLNIGIYSNLTSQTVKPDFYDSLSAEEQKQFDALPKEQQEQIKDTYYDLV